jgi:hypothetical protein
VRKGTVGRWNIRRCEPFRIATKPLHLGGDDIRVAARWPNKTEEDHDAKQCELGREKAAAAMV